jgi:drug/metabolite transporter (DMT)-like permease
MLGIIFAIVSALAFAFGDIGKKLLSNNFHPWVITAIPVGFGVTLGAIYYLFIGVPAEIYPRILGLAAISGVLLLLVELRFLKSISSGEMSLVMPLTALVPFFSAVIAWFSHGELPSLTSAIGILILISGSWAMFADSSDWRHIFRPFTRMFSDPASRYMLEFCVLDAIFVSVMNYGADFVPASYFLWLTLIFELLFISLLLISKRLNPIAPFIIQPKITFGTGLFWSLAMILIFEAMALTMVAHATAANRVHTVFIVLLSYLLFKEQEFKKRLLTSIFMVIGVCLLILGS